MLIRFHTLSNVRDPAVSDTKVQTTNSTACICQYFRFLNFRSQFNIFNESRSIIVNLKHSTAILTDLIKVTIAGTLVSLSANGMDRA